MYETTGTKINNLNLRSRIRPNKNIFRLQITMNQIQIMNEIQSIQNLLRNS